MTTPEPAPKPRRTRRTKAENEAEQSASPPDGTDESETAAPKPRRKRKTKAEKEAERIAQMAADAEKPLLEPKAWMAFGLLLLTVGICIYLDPIGFEQSGQSGNEPWIKTILVLLLAFLGKNPVSIGLGVLGALAVVWGVIGWVREKSQNSKA